VRRRRRRRRKRPEVGIDRPADQAMVEVGGGGGVTFPLA